MYYMYHIIAMCSLSVLLGIILTSLFIILLKQEKPKKGGILPYEQAMKMLDQIIETRIESFLFVEDSHFLLTQNLDLKNTLEKKIDLTDDIIVGLSPTLSISLKTYLSLENLREYVILKVFNDMTTWVENKKTKGVNDKKVFADNVKYDKKVDLIFNDLKADLSLKHSTNTINALKPIIKEIIDKSNISELDDGNPVGDVRYKQIKADILFEISEEIENMSLFDKDEENKNKEFNNFYNIPRT